jgi:hypothetical protein
VDGSLPIFYCLLWIKSDRTGGVGIEKTKRSSYPPPITNNLFRWITMTDVATIVVAQVRTVASFGKNGFFCIILILINRIYSTNIFLYCYHQLISFVFFDTTALIAVFPPFVAAFFFFLPPCFLF